jgi:molybdopterin molybdotransferase
LQAGGGLSHVTQETPLRLEVALGHILAGLTPVAAAESVPLAAALGRILADDVVSPIDVPGADNSAVDGYAVHAEDLAAAGETRLPVIGRAAAGHPFAGSLPRGQALRIFTGALMPAGADTVVMQEDCGRVGEFVVLPAGLKPGSNRRRAGEDVKAGTRVLTAGLRLRPQEIGLAAAVGRTHLRVRTPLRAAVFSLGEPGSSDIESHQGASRLGLAALLRNLGLLVDEGSALPDEARLAGIALAEAAARSDVILISGGVAASLAPAIGSEGSFHLWHLAVKPGRMVASGHIESPKGAVPWLGLPGNPVAAITAFLCVVRPVALRLMGASDLALPRYPLSAAFDHRKKPGWREFLRARRTAAGA